MTVSSKKKAKNVSQEWKVSEDLPTGWTMRQTSSENNRKVPKTYTYLCSPSGRVFYGRKQALQFMLERGHSSSDVEIMRAGLLQEGWTDHHLLPKGWKVRDRGQSCEFLNEEAEVVKSYSDALKTDFPQETKEKLKAFIDDKTKTRRVTNNDFHSDDSLPKGWKCRGTLNSGTPGSGFYILSPTNEQFPARRVALRSQTTFYLTLIDLFKVHDRSWLSRGGFGQDEGGDVAGGMDGRSASSSKVVLCQDQAFHQKQNAMDLIMMFSSGGE